MNIFLTGGAGYIGSHTVVELISQGYDVIVADNLSNSKPEAIRRLKEITGKDFPFYEMDVRDSNKLDEVFVKHNIDVVIHFAGFKAVGESVAKPLDYYENNLNSTIALCEAMKKHNVSKIIFSSSATVYSGNNEMPLTENSNIGNCACPYGWTKFMNEQILTDTVNANDGWSLVLLRYFNPIGAHESGRIGEDPNGIPNNLLPYISQTAIGKFPYLTVHGDDYNTPDGTCIRDYIHVVDLAKGHTAALKYIQNNNGVSVFNLGTGKGVSVFEFVTAFEEATGIKINKKIGPRRSGDLPYAYASTEKAKKELGWEAVKSLTEACADSWRWQKNNPNGFE